MAKRFTSCNIWDEDWFLEMPEEYMLFWGYLKDKCDHAGIWKPNKINFEATVLKNKKTINLDAALQFFNKEKERIIVLPNGRWLLIGFFEFQYGNIINLNNRVHSSAYQLFNLNGVNLTSIRPLLEVKDGVKDKDKDKDKLNKGAEEKPKFNELESLFEEARKMYPGSKNGAGTELMNLKKKHSDWKEVIPTFKEKISNQIRNRVIKNTAGEFVAPWKNFSTWINKRCWEEEAGVAPVEKGENKHVMPGKINL
jgi:hypothetical protein